MNFQSFLLSSSSIIGHHLSNLSEHQEFELHKQKGKRMPSKDDSFFKTGDPDIDPI